MSLYTRLMKSLRDDPKVEILAEARGARAVKAIQTVFFGDDEAKAKEWAEQFSPATLRGARLVVFSMLKRKHRDVHFRIVLGRDSVLGERRSWATGQALLRKVLDV